MTPVLSLNLAGRANVSSSECVGGTSVEDEAEGEDWQPAAVFDCHAGGVACVRCCSMCVVSCCLRECLLTKLSSCFPVTFISPPPSSCYRPCRIVARACPRSETRGGAFCRHYCQANQSSRHSLKSRVTTCAGVGRASKARYAMTHHQGLSRCCPHE